MKRNLIHDISSITQIKDNTLGKIVDVSNMCICDYMNELDMLDDEYLSIDIGIGYLQLLKVDTSIEYRFVPNSALESAIVDTLENKQNPLVKAAETNLNSKITNTYKELV